MMKGLATCQHSGKTVRYLSLPVSGVIAVDAETTSGEDKVFDGKRHVQHRATCKHEWPAAALAREAKKPCNCGKKKLALKLKTS